MWRRCRSVEVFSRSGSGRSPRAGLWRAEPSHRGDRQRVRHHDEAAVVAHSLCSMLIHRLIDGCSHQDHSRTAAAAPLLTAGNLCHQRNRRLPPSGLSCSRLLLHSAHHPVLTQPPLEPAVHHLNAVRVARRLRSTESERIQTAVTLQGTQIQLEMHAGRRVGLLDLVTQSTRSRAACLVPEVRLGSHNPRVPNPNPDAVAPARERLWHKK